MEYLEFTEQIRKAVEKKCGGELRVNVGRVLKNNRNMVETLSIMKQGENMSPAFSVRPLYDRYRRGATVEEIAGHILDCYGKGYQGGSVDLSFYMDYSAVRDRITCRLVNYERNRELLKRTPHERYLDLAVVYHCRVDGEVLGHAFAGQGSILVQNAHMDMWEVTPEELHDAAVSNTVRLLPYDLIDLRDMLRDMLELEPEREVRGKSPMYVLTNSEKWYGAVNILFDSVLEAVGERLKSDFYVLPSSVHECMIVPAGDGVEARPLRQMVHEINGTFVEPEEILGDSVYFYNRREHLLAVGDG